MSTTTIAVDLAKNVFEIAVASRTGVIQERKRLDRAGFQQFWVRRARCRVVMEACSSAHFWARLLRARGFDVVLLPAHYVKPYRRGNKTDRADCEAILEAHRCAGIHPVGVKSEEQQALIALHRVRSQWLESRTARINVMRGVLREFGVVAPTGSKRFMKELPGLLSKRYNALPDRVRRTVMTLWDEVRDLEQRVDHIAREFESVALQEPAVQALMKIPGVGLLTATALFATVADIHGFRSGRQLACWIGLTPREFSSGSRRHLGRISKRGDSYLRMLLIHGARSALNAARRLAKVDKPVTQLQAWALYRASQSHPNKAVVALANKLARIAWAVWHHEREFDGNYVVRTGV
jgi:transposase